MSLPYRLLYQGFEQSVGGLREDFFAQTCKMSSKNIAYLKSTVGAKTPDYVLSGENLVFEIGGRGKGRSQFKGFKAERKILLIDSYDINTPDKKPLFALGLVS